MPSLPGLAGILNAALSQAQVTYGCTLIKLTRGLTDPAAPMAGPAITETAYPCKGFIATRTNRPMPQSSTTQGNRYVVLMGASLPAGVEPMPDDVIEIEGRRVTIATGGVEGDPALASWSCDCRGL